MRTPDGRECPYYYADYHRRSTAREVCRLLEGSVDEPRWRSTFCATCPVPAIRQANACQQMYFRARIGKSSTWRFWEAARMLITAHCTRQNDAPVKNPHVGCGQCHEPFTFVVEQE